MHGFLHRALAPQTLAYVWLVCTVALTLALALAQPAIAAPASTGPSIRPMPAPALVTGEVVAAPTPAPAPDRAGAPCTAPASGETAARPAPRCPAIPNVLFAPAETSRSASLASLFGTAGPHGPPAGRAIATTPAISASIGQSLPRITFDFSLSHALRGPDDIAVAAASSAPVALGALPAHGTAAPVGAPL